MTEKILVVDDDPYIRIILQKRLSTRGYEIIPAENGEEGWQKAKSEMPDLIVSDWMMPKMDGLEFCKKVKTDERLRYTYFVLLTAKDTQDDRIEGIETGADDYLTKPFNDKDLLTRIKAGLRINNLQKELAALQHQKAITELAITLGHEINNPLGIMMLTLQVIQRKGDNQLLAGVRKELEICIHNGKRVAEIVKRLARLEDPHLVPYLKNSDTEMLDLSQAQSASSEETS
ncbi:MAG: response regulator [Bacteroidota bacterium]|nr:response regulator [Bacteroidota bacterium]